MSAIFNHGWQYLQCLLLREKVLCNVLVLASNVGCLTCARTSSPSAPSPFSADASPHGRPSVSCIAVLSRLTCELTQVISRIVTATLIIITVSVFC